MAANPSARIYHYNHYEPTALKRLAMRHGTREAELDALLREQRFVDLYVVVREALRISEPRYSLKNVERFYRPAREGEVGTAADSIVAFERWLESGDEAILHGIEAYNRDDCASTRELRDWLISLRPGGMPWAAAQADDRHDESPSERSARRRRRRKLAIQARLVGRRRRKRNCPSASSSRIWLPFTDASRSPSGGRCTTGRIATPRSWLRTPSALADWRPPATHSRSSSPWPGLIGSRRRIRSCGPDRSDGRGNARRTSR